MRRGSTWLVGLPALLLGTMPAPAAGGAVTTGLLGPFAACAVEGVLWFSPGLTVEPKPTRAGAELVLHDCVSSDPTVRSARATAHGFGDALGCTGGRFDGEVTVVWNNGRTSGFHWSAVGVPPIGFATATVNRGSQFRGATFTADVLLADPDAVNHPQACLSPTGITEIRGVGTAHFGPPYST